MNGHTQHQIPVVDVDQAFPTMVDTGGPTSDGAGEAGVTTAVATVVRDVLGMRPRAQDPQAFLDALRASFNLRLVEGHVEAVYVPRGAAVMSDLGAVSGGQASLYRRATLARAEALRILEGLTALRPDADADDMASYRTLVRDAVGRLVDEIGAAGGPRVQMVDMYFAGLTGDARPVPGVDADTVNGQLGALRDRFGLTDENSNTVDDESVRTSFWTLVDLITDLQTSWSNQRVNFSSQAGQGFLGTDVILLSRLMEAAVDQVDELERVLSSVLIPLSERRTIVLDAATGLTLDGLLMWLRSFLGDEGRRIVQDTGRDGIVSALAPMAVQLVKTFREVLADRVDYFVQKENAADTDDRCCPVLLLPVSCCGPLPTGMYAARTRVAIAALCRLLMELARTAQRIGRFARPVLLNVTFRPVFGRPGFVEVDVRGINLRLNHIPAFVIGDVHLDDGECRIEEIDPDLLVLPLRGSSTADDDSVVATFGFEEFTKVRDHVRATGAWAEQVRFADSSNDSFESVTVPAEALPLALIDGERGVAVMAPPPVTWPRLREAVTPVDAGTGTKTNWYGVPEDERFRTVPKHPLLEDVPDQGWVVEPDDSDADPDDDEVEVDSEEPVGFVEVIDTDGDGAPDAVMVAVLDPEWWRQAVRHPFDTDEATRQAILDAAARGGIQVTREHTDNS